MPVIRLNWTTYAPHDAAPYLVDPGTGWVPAPWLTVVEWRDPAHTLIDPIMGVYIIEDNPASPIYTGQAQSLRDRFDGRSSTLHEYNIKAAMMVNWTVWASSVTISPPSAPFKLDWAEYWLIRFLFVRDHKPANAPPRLQNRLLVGSFDAPADGLDISFDPRSAPAYLNDPTTPGYARNAAGTLIRYSYAPYAPVIP